MEKTLALDGSTAGAPRQWPRAWWLGATLQAFVAAAAALACAAIRARCVRTMRSVSFGRRRVWRVQYGRGFTEGLPSIRAWDWRGGLCLGNLAKAADRRAHGGGGGGVKCVRAARNLRRREKGTGKY